MLGAEEHLVTFKVGSRFRGAHNAYTDILMYGTEHLLVVAI